MELRHLRYFIRAAELLHFTRAAESLYISQPSLSVHIQQLEEELKTKLFARVGRNVHLTESGQVLLIHAKRAVEELEIAGKEIDALSGLLRGSLRVATLPLFGSKVLPAWINSFSLLHPNVRVDVRAETTDAIESDLLNGNIDLGFSLVPVEHAELNTKQIFADEMVMVVSKKHPLAKKEKLAPADLMSVSIAMPSHKISSTRLMGPYFESIEVSPNIVIEQDDGHAILELVKLGDFATFLPKLAIRDNPEVCLLPLPAPGILVSFVAVWSQLNPASTAFLDIATSANGKKVAGD